VFWWICSLWRYHYSLEPQSFLCSWHPPWSPGPQANTGLSSITLDGLNLLEFYVNGSPQCAGFWPGFFCSVQVLRSLSMLFFESIVDSGLMSHATPSVFIWSPAEGRRCPSWFGSRWEHYICLCSAQVCVSSLGCPPGGWNYWSHLHMLRSVVKELPTFKLWLSLSPCLFSSLFSLSDVPPYTSSCQTRLCILCSLVLLQMRLQNFSCVILLFLEAHLIYIYGPSILQPLKSLRSSNSAFLYTL
jgi:hypothetical protein